MLFVGNSLTYWNGMPSMVRKLAHRDPGARKLFVAQYTAPGWDLKRAAKHNGLRELLEEVSWDDVVLQERRDVRRPFYEALHERIRARSGRTVIFGLWGVTEYAAAAARANPARDRRACRGGRGSGIPHVAWDVYGARAMTPTRYCESIALASKPPASISTARRMRVRGYSA